LSRSIESFSDLPSKKLSALFEFVLGKPMANAHDALADVTANLELIRAKPYVDCLSGSDSDDSILIARLTDPMFSSLKWFQQRHAKKHVGRVSLTVVGGSDLDLSDEEVWSDGGDDGAEPDADDGWEDVTESLPNTNAHVRDWAGPDVEFTQRRTVGPVGIEKDWNERRVFLSLFTMQLVKLGVRYTNMYASQRHREKWRDTYDTEFICFLGLLLYMGAKQITRADAWKEFPWGDEFLKTVMSQWRFRELYACLHFVDNDAFGAAARKLDAFWKIRPCVNKLVKRFSAAFVPGQHLSVDEITTPAKGRHRAKQYNKSKPCKWGFKSFAMCCAVTGYCMSLYPYMGRDQARPAGMSLGEFAVTSVLLPMLNNNGYVISADNWFTSVELVDKLLKMGIHYCGTARKGRKGLPSRETFSLPSKCARGTMKVLHNSTKGLFATVWRDNKDVRMLSSFAAPKGKVERSVKATATSSFQKIETDSPCVIGLYNRTMGGVDLNDQGTAYVRPCIRSRRPTRNLFLHLLLITAYNARVLFCLARGWSVADVTMKEFNRAVSMQLMQPFIDREKAQAPPKDHFPAVVADQNSRRRCKQCTAAKRKPKKSRLYCQGCKGHPFLCPDGTETTCWSDWHANMQHVT
jgi:hypothetical protein